MNHTVRKVTGPPKVFVSSALGPEGGTIRCLRDRLHAWAQTAGIDAFFFEKRKSEAEWNALGAAGSERICVENVDQADVFIGIFHNSYGGSHRIHLADVSFTDLEFFEAFRRDIPVHIYIYESVCREPELESLLTIVRSLVPNAVKRFRSVSSLEAAVKRDLDRHFGRRPSSYPGRFANFFTRLTTARQRHDDCSEGIRFLLDRYPPARTVFSRENALRALSALAEFQSYDARLNATWQVFRQLFAVPWRTHHETWDVWDRTLGSWDKPAAWLGLHGFTFAGKLAANNTQLAVRALLASKGESDSLPDLIRRAADKTGSPDGWAQLFSMGGVLASEYYSIARRVAAKALERKYYLKAGAWCEVAARADRIAPNFERRSAVASIHGQTLMRLGEESRAIELLEESLRCRVEGSLGAASENIGKMELGFAYFEIGRKAEGERLVEEGAEGLKSSGSPGFLVRAKKRLIAIHLRRGRFTRALREWREAKKIAEEHGLADQLEDLRRVLKRH